MDHCAEGIKGNQKSHDSRNVTKRESISISISATLHYKYLGITNDLHAINLFDIIVNYLKLPELEVHFAVPTLINTP